MSTVSVLSACGGEVESECKAACDAGDAVSCRHLGHLALVQERFAAAATAFGRGCERDDADACGGLAELVEQGRAAVGESATSLRLRACALGDELQCSMATLRAPNDSRVPPALLKQCERLASSSVCAMAASAYDTGLAVPANPALATSLLDRACALMKSDGPMPSDVCVRAASRYVSGLGTSVSLAKARALYERSCDSGLEALGCGELGRLYETGQGVPPDTARARALYARACVGHTTEEWCIRATGRPFVEMTSAASALCKAAYALYVRGDYAGAEPGLRQCEAKVPRPKTLYFLAVCLDRLGRADARAAYQHYLTEALPFERAPIEDAQRRIASLHP